MAVTQLWLATTLGYELKLTTLSQKQALELTLGAEKFLDIKCRFSVALLPECRCCRCHDSGSEDFTVACLLRTNITLPNLGTLWRLVLLTLEKALSRILNNSIWSACCSSSESTLCPTDTRRRSEVRIQSKCADYLGVQAIISEANHWADGGDGMPLSWREAVVDLAENRIW